MNISIDQQVDLIEEEYKRFKDSCPVDENGSKYIRPEDVTRALYIKNEAVRLAEVLLKELHEPITLMHSFIIRDPIFNDI